MYLPTLAPLRGDFLVVIGEDVAPVIGLSVSFVAVAAEIVSNTVNSKFSREFYFHETLHMQSYMKIKSSRNGDITLSVTDIGKSSLVANF